MNFLNRSKEAVGHLTALLTIVIWGTTFISTKILLVEFRPVEILFFRFALGFLALLAAYPKRLKGLSPRQEMTLAAAGLCGICLYYLLENIALTYTMASNVGVILSAAPFFTAILSRLLMRSEEKLRGNFFIGFAVAMVGIVMVSLNGEKFEVNPLGDILAVAAALVWGCYSLLTKKIAGFGCPIILTTRRTFFYGLLFMTPTLFFFDFQADLTRFSDVAYLLNMLYLGLGASAMCFVTWNLAVKRLGAVRTSVYIYMVPAVTIATSALVLKEPVTKVSAAGALLTVAGLFLSERGGRDERGRPTS